MIFTSGYGNQPRKKCFSVAVLLVFLCALHPMWGQARSLSGSDTSHKHWSQVPALADYSVEFNVRTATCYDNGQVGFVIVDKTHNNTPISSAQFTSVGFNDFGIGYQATTMDTLRRWVTGFSYSTTDTTWVLMSSGTFNITLRFTIPDPVAGFIEVDTTVQLTVNLEYTEPSVAALTVISHDGVRAGNIPSLRCKNTGRIQVRVDGGRSPYYFTVVRRGTTDTICDTAVVMHPATPSTSDSVYADFYKYVTFDNLSAGEYDFYFKDDCGYGFNLPATTQSIGNVDPPRLKNVEIYASSGNPRDVNVVKIKAVLSGSEYPIYMDQFYQYMQYHFLNGTTDSNAVPYKPLFPNGLPSNYNGSSDLKVTLYDTIRLGEHPRYCDFWGRLDTLVLLVSEENGLCGKYYSTDTFSVRNTNRGYYEQGDEKVIESITPIDQCTQAITHHDDNFFFRYKDNKPNYVNPDRDHVNYRYHFTYPIIWEYKEYPNQTLLKRDTIWGVDTDNIARRSVLTVQEIYNAYSGAFANGTQTISVSLKDTLNCELYNSNRVTLRLNQVTDNSASPIWRVTAVKKPLCCNQKRSITISEENAVSGSIYDGTTITLTDCPDMATYGFTAVYSEQEQDWIYTWADFINGPELTGLTDRKGLTFSGFCLPPGTYTFEVSNAPCVNGTITITQELPEITTVELGEEPVCKVVSNCTQNFLTYTQGRIAVKTITASGESIEFKETDFKMVNGPTGGYDPLSNISGHVPAPGEAGDSIRISIHTGTDHPYIFKIFPHSSEGLCGDLTYYDTVYYNGNNLKFDFAWAILCNDASAEGPVYVHVNQGTPPYTYYLYRGPNATDTIVDWQTPANDTAIFHDITMSTLQEMSCKVIDACGAFFTVNFYPQSLADLQKTWFDGGVKVSEQCEGTYVQLHTLNAGNIFRYDWYKVGPTPEEDEPIATTAEPFFFLPRGLETADFRVEILVTDCTSDPYRDTITVYPKKAPELGISLTPDEVCPGEKAVISFTPISYNYNEPYSAEHPAPVNFRVAYETAQGVEIRSYNNVPHGTTVYDSIFPFLETEIYAVEINDSRCDYEVVDRKDTVHISTHVVSPCSIETWHDTVCFKDNAVLKARCDADADANHPNILSWYSDFSLTNKLQGPEPLWQANHDTSYYSLPELQQNTIMFVSVAKEDWCPASNLTANGVVNLSGTDGSTTMACTSSILFYDDGGPGQNYSTNANGNNYHTHLFISDPDNHRPVTLHFDTLALAEGSSLMIFSGEEPIEDSLLAQFSVLDPDEIIETPDVIMSRGNKMLVYFKPGPNSEYGWRAYVRPSPGIAVGNVVMPKTKSYTVRTCQSQNKAHFNSSEISNLIPSVVSQAQLDDAIRSSGTYIWNSKTQSVLTGCDSTTILNFVVDAAPRRDTLAVTTSLTGVMWMDSLYKTPGSYVVNTPSIDGDQCDFFNVLNLIVIEVKIPVKNVCFGRTTVIGLEVITNDEVKPRNPYLEERHTVGDVLCWNKDRSKYEVYRPEEFREIVDSLFNIEGLDIENLPLKPHGVVTFLYPNNSHGKAISIVDVGTGDKTLWAANNQMSNIHSLTCVSQGNYSEAHWDVNGIGNTQKIMHDADSACHDVQLAPAAYYCYFYDPDVQDVNGVVNGWYLPAAGEMYLCFAYRDVINHTLAMLSDLGFNAAQLSGNKDGAYWSSTEAADSKKIYAVSINGKGQVHLGIQKDANRTYTFMVRAMFEF